MAIDLPSLSGPGVMLVWGWGHEPTGAWPAKLTGQPATRRGEE
jgi:hypothetical protein